MSFWLMHRLLCSWCGHRSIWPAPSYAALLADGRVRELYFCRVCGTPFWKVLPATTPPDRPTWLNLQI